VVGGAAGQVTGYAESHHNALFAWVYMKLIIVIFFLLLLLLFFHLLLLLLLFFL
jgi:hypothetical protein